MTLRQARLSCDSHNRDSGCPPPGTPPGPGDSPRQGIEDESAAHSGTIISFRDAGDGLGPFEEDGARILLPLIKVLAGLVEVLTTGRT